MLSIWIALTLLIFNFLQSVIAPPPIGVVEIAHDGAPGIYEAHDLTGAKATIESSGSHPISTSPVCRRTLNGCSSLPISERISPSRSSRPSETVTQQKLSGPRKWAKSFTSNVHDVPGKAVWAIRSVRDEWNMAQATYELTAVNAARSLGTWNDRGNFVKKLSELSFIRKRTTVEYGGFSSQINNYLSGYRLPKIANELRTSMNEIIVSIKNGEPDLQTPRKVLILKKIYEAEIQDRELGKWFEDLKPSLDELSDKFQSAPLTGTDLDWIRAPPRPTFANLKAPSAGEQRTHYEWMKFQFDAEQEHFAYLDDSNHPARADWNQVTQDGRLFKEAAIKRGAWGEGRFQPDLLKKKDYILLESIESKRRNLIDEAGLLAQQRPRQGHAYDTLSEIREEVAYNQFSKLEALQSLVIESISQPTSGEALIHLQQLAQHRQIAKKPLELALRYQDQVSLPPPSLNEIIRLRNEQVNELRRALINAPDPRLEADPRARPSAPPLPHPSNPRSSEVQQAPVRSISTPSAPPLPHNHQEALIDASIGRSSDLRHTPSPSQLTHTSDPPHLQSPESNPDQTTISSVSNEDRERQLWIESQYQSLFNQHIDTVLEADDLRTASPDLRAEALNGALDYGSSVRQRELAREFLENRIQHDVQNGV